MFYMSHFYLKSILGDAHDHIQTKKVASQKIQHDIKYHKRKVEPCFCKMHFSII